MSTIFHIDEKGEAVKLQEIKYESEDLLQTLVEKHPDILAGEQIDPDKPRRWILISREMGVPGEEGGSSQWFLDHLFIDQDGIPTFVEVKRSTDTRIRREVVAQMLDYAANATVYWPASLLRQTFEENNPDALEVLKEKLGIDVDEADSFWERVDNNLRLGKLRLLFVADEIPKSLQRIIEFLNGQMTDTEVLGLEIKQYVSSTKQRTLVPKLVGDTISAKQVKKADKVEWNRESFLNRVSDACGEEMSKLCERLLKDFSDMGCRIYWGTGSTYAGFVPIYDGKKNHQLFAVYSYRNNTKAEIYFQHFKAPFDSVDKRKELQAKFNCIDGVQIPDMALTKRPSVDGKVLLSEDNYNKFISVYRDMLAEIKHYEET